MFDVDVHILTLSDSNPDWLEQCVESLRHEPCNVHIVNGVDGHLGQSRAIGYSKGSAPFVAHVDCDDFVIPGVIDACLDAFNTRPEINAVVTNERVLYESGEYNLSLRGRHHLYMARRSCVEPLFPTCSKHKYRVDREIMNECWPLQIPFVGYVWRVHSGGFHHQELKHGTHHD